MPHYSILVLKIDKCDTCDNSVTDILFKFNHNIKINYLYYNNLLVINVTIEIYQFFCRIKNDNAIYHICKIKQIKLCIRAILFSHR